MPTTIRELLIAFGVDADTDALDAFDASIDKVKANMDDLVGFAAKAAVAVAAFTGALVYQAVATGENAELIKEQSAALGITTDAYQELSFAMAGAGIDAEKITVIFSKLAVDQKALADGNEETAKTYALLGISAQEAAAATPEELFKRMADGFAGVTDASERLAIASSLFGDRIASKLIPLLSKGSVGLEEMAQQAHDFGVVMSEDAVDAADAFNGQVEVLGLTLEGLRNKIGSAVIPTLTRLADRFLGWYEANQDVIDQKIEEYAEKVGDAFVAVADAITAADKALGGADGWAKFAEFLALLTGAAGLGYVVVKLVALASSVWGVVTAAAAVVGGGGPLLAILAAIGGALAQVLAAASYVAAVFLAYQDIWTYLQGGESVFGRLIERFREAGGWLGSLANLMQAWGGLAQAILGRVTQLWQMVYAAALPVFDLFGAIGNAILTGIGGALDAIAPALDWAAAKLTQIATLINGGVAPTVPGATAAGGTSSTPSYAGASSAGASYSAPFAPTASRSTTSATASVVVQGDTISISGLGLSEAEVKALLRAHSEEKARKAATTFAQREV